MVPFSQKSTGAIFPDYSFSEKLLDRIEEDLQAVSFLIVVPHPKS